MVKVQAIIEFTYKKYDKIKKLESKTKKEKGKIFKDDIFEIDDEEALYLTGKNDKGIVAVKVLEVMPNMRVIKDKEESKEIITRSRKKINKKKEDK